MLLKKYNFCQNICMLLQSFYSEPYNLNEINFHRTRPDVCTDQGGISLGIKYLSFIHFTRNAGILHTVLQYQNVSSHYITVGLFQGRVDYCQTTSQCKELLKLHEIIK